MQFFKENGNNKYYDLDIFKTGFIEEKTKLLMPDDNSVIKITKYFTGPRKLEE